VLDAEPILSAARKRGAQQVEVFAVESYETPVRFEANRLKELNARQTKGAALRVIVDGRIGFASSTYPDDVDGLVEAAAEAAPFGPLARFELPGPAEAPVVQVFDPRTQAVSADEMIHWGQSLIDAARNLEPKLVCDATVRRVVQTVTLANSNGGGFSYRASALSASLHGTLIRDTDMLFVGDYDASCSPDLDWKRIEETIERQLRYSRRNAALKMAQMPVIFTPLGVAESLLTPLALAFSGRLVHQGQSPLVDRLGEQLYDSRFSMWDDATISLRAASRPFDDEGVPSRRIQLVENGVVRSFLYDLQTAALAGAESTASAERSLASQPSISTTCVTIAAGDTTFEDMLDSVSEGVVVEELMGAGQGNVMGGDFSGNVLLGYKIEGGEIVGRVKDTIVAGNVHEALRQLGAVGSDSRWVGGVVNTPSLLFEHLTVSSRT
jgi:PmbA protein